MESQPPPTRGLDLAPVRICPMNVVVRGITCLWPMGSSEHRSQQRYSGYMQTLPSPFSAISGSPFLAQHCRTPSLCVMCMLRCASVCGGGGRRACVKAHCAYSMSMCGGGHALRVGMHAAYAGDCRFVTVWHVLARMFTVRTMFGMS